MAALLVSLISRIKHEANLIDRAAFFAILAHYGDTVRPSITEELFSMPIDIVVGQYRYIKPAPEENLGERRKKTVEAGGRSMPFNADILFNDLKDVRAAQRIHTELEKLSFKNIRIVQDTDDRDAERKPTCEILIGLCINKRVNDALENMPHPRLFAIEPESNGHYSIALAETSPAGIVSPPSRTRHMNESGGEVMLISKFWHHGHVQILVGGLSDEGTLICADTFADRLVELVDEQDASSKKAIGSNRFAAVLKCHPMDYPSPVMREVRVA